MDGYITLAQKKLINLMIRLNYVLIEYNKTLKEIEECKKIKDVNKLIELNNKLEQEYKEINKINELLNNINNL